MASPSEPARRSKWDVLSTVGLFTYAGVWLAVSRDIVELATSVALVAFLIAVTLWDRHVRQNHPERYESEEPAWAPWVFGGAAAFLALEAFVYGGWEEMLTGVILALALVTAAIASRERRKRSN